MAPVSGADVTSIKLLASGLNFTGKCDALFNLVRHREAPLNQSDRIDAYPQVVRVFALLHNDIVYSVWIEGESPNSIWPMWLNKRPWSVIKAQHDIDTHGKPFIADDDDRVAYTIDDLQQICESIAGNFAAFQDYAVLAGLVVERPDRTAAQ